MMNMFTDMTAYHRAAAAACTALVVSLIAGAWLIRFFRRRNVIEDTRQPDHAGLNAIASQKKNVPTMGGLMIIAGIMAALVMWTDMANPFVQMALVVIAVLGGAGFADDYIKLKKKPARGLNKKQKLIIQFLLGGALGYFLMRHGGSQVRVPFAGMVDFGPWYLLWTGFVMAATSNAVNLTDGLDGLAGGCMAMAALALAMLIWPVNGAVSVLTVSVAAATLGFLWFNVHPAQIFMGDTGSLMLGGLLAYVALAARLDFVLFAAGLVFFVNEATVALQIASFKLTGKRIFPITPIHHYFQVHRKWPEQKIVTRAWMLACVSAVSAFYVAERLQLK